MEDYTVPVIPVLDFGSPFRLPLEPKRDNCKRGSRQAKRKRTNPANQEHSRPAERQAERLEQAIAKRLERNTLSTNSEGADPAPADRPERTPEGVTYVSLDSESDCPGLPSEEDPLSDESVAAGGAGTSSASDPARTITRPSPYHTVETVRASVSLSSTIKAT